MSSSSKAHYQAHNNVYRLVLLISIVLFISITSVFIVLQQLQGSWSNWKQATCMPDGCFCEEPTGTLLQQPTNTYTNLAFCFVGCVIFVMIAHTLDEPNKDDAESVFWLYATVYAMGNVLLGLGSGLYHASLVFVFQVMDNVGMYFIICWAFAYNLVRISPKRFQQQVFFSVYLSLIAIFTAVNVYLPVVRRFAFFGMVIVYIISEYYVDMRKKEELGVEDYQMNWKVWIIALLSIAIGFVFWNLDQNKVLCNPKSVWQGHGLWHCLCATSSFCLFYFYWLEKKKPANMNLLKRREQQQQLQQQEMEPQVIEQEESITTQFPPQPQMVQLAVHNAPPMNRPIQYVYMPQQPMMVDNNPVYDHSPPQMIYQQQQPPHQVPQQQQQPYHYSDPRAQYQQLYPISIYKL
jgi:uncharacterized membrane protein YfcA